MTSNIFIAQILDVFHSFLGVFPSDEYPKLPRIKHGVLGAVFNTKSSKEHVCGHWVLISYFIYDYKLIFCEIFDSLSLNENILPTNIIEYISSLKTHVKYSKIRVQSLESEFCGIFCIARFLSIYLNECLNVFLAKFDTRELMVNDRKVVVIIRKYLKIINEENQR